MLQARHVTENPDYFKPPVYTGELVSKSHDFVDAYGDARNGSFFLAPYHAFNLFLKRNDAEYEAAKVKSNYWDYRGRADEAKD